jgi:Flp pilus assembly protein TadG
MSIARSPSMLPRRFQRDLCAFSWLRNSLWRNEAAQIVELAVTLPLMVVLLVGIFDFGQAFNVKQRIGDAAREAARLAASQPTDDLGLGRPPSVDTIVSFILNNLTGANVLSGNAGSCTAAGATVAHSPGSFTWQYTVNNCPQTLTVTVNRALAIPYTSGGNTVNVVASKVTVSYPYIWHFNSAIKLIVPSANYAATTPISVDAVLQNLD